MVLTVNGTTLGEYAERSSSHEYYVAKPSGVNKTARIASYTTGVGQKIFTISFSCSNVGTIEDALDTLFTNGEGVYYFYDPSNHIFMNKHGVWANVEKMNSSPIQQDHVNSIDRGEITLDCTVAIDGTGSTYTPP